MSRFESKLFKFSFFYKTYVFIVICFDFIKIPVFFNNCKFFSIENLRGKFGIFLSIFVYVYTWVFIYHLSFTGAIIPIQYIKNNTGIPNKAVSMK